MQPLPEPGEAEKHALQHAGRTDMSHQKNITTDSWIDVSARSQAKETVSPDVEESKKCPCLAASASLWRLPSLLAMTHMRWCRGHSGHPSTERTLCGLLCQWVVGLARRWCSNKAVEQK